MLAVLRAVRTRVFYQLAKLDVVAADRAFAVGDANRSAKLLARADIRLKKACGLVDWACDR